MGRLYAGCPKKDWNPHKLINYAFASRKLKSIIYLYFHSYTATTNERSHLRVSRPPLYPLSYRLNGDWWRVLSNLSGRNIFTSSL